MSKLHPSRLRRRGLIATAAVAMLAVFMPLAASGLASAGASPSHHGGDHHHGPKPTIVLVHGDWADGSSWSRVVERLQRRGYTVVAPPNPLRGPTTDAPYLASFLSTIPGPIVLVGHSYGGFVITNAALGNSNVKALVYIDAFIPDTGQVLAGLAASAGGCLDPGTAFNAVPTAAGVDLYLRTEANGTYAGFDECFANGVPRSQAAVLAAVQRPAALDQLTQPSGPPAWASIRSWALVGDADRVIPPASQEAMASHAHADITHVNAGHLSLVSRPDAVTKVILDAVSATS